MSQNIRAYNYPKWGAKLFVTAFVCERENNPCVQFTVIEEGRTSCVCLSKAQIKDLIDILQKRLDGEITATGEEMFPPKEMLPDGVMVVSEDL